MNIKGSAPLLLLAAGAIALGHALQLRNGFYDPLALAWLTGALILTAAGALTLGRLPIPSTNGRRALLLLLVLGIGWQLFDLARWWPGTFIDRTGGRAFYRAGLLVEVPLVLASLLTQSKIRRYWFPALVITHTLLGVWVIRRSPSPKIDVVQVHDAAIDALREGRTPYDVRFANLYGGNTIYYPRANVDGGTVRWGYPYPPLSLLVVTPFKLAFGDYRYGLLAALIAGVLWIGYARPGPLSPLAAAVLLTQPRGFYVLEQGWTEPIVIALLAATTAGMLRGTAWSTGWRAGLLLVTKQYLVFPAALFLRFLFGRAAEVGSRPARTLAIVIAVGACATIPFLLADPGGFTQFVFRQQASEPFRLDSLSYLSLAARLGWGQGSLAVAVAAACVALIVSWRWIPNTAAGFAAGTALTLFAAFAFGSKAFCNYYYLVIGALCCAIASADSLVDKSRAGGLVAHTSSPGARRR